MNSTHQVAAAASQFGSNGRQYAFQAWNNNGAASQNITVNQSAASNGMIMTAAYNIIPRVVIQSTPPGLTLQVDGATCQTPCNIDRTNGTQVHVTAPTTISMGAGARLSFRSWSDGGTADHMITVGQDYTTLNASFTPFYQLSAASNPASAVTFHFSPSSSDIGFGRAGVRQSRHIHSRTRTRCSVRVCRFHGEAVGGRSRKPGHRERCAGCGSNRRSIL